MKSMKGFTLIELIIVIILISIVSVLGIGLLSSTDQYSARLASDRWLAGFRLAQRLSLQKQNSNQLVTLTVAENSTEWLFSLDQGSINLNEFSIEKERVVVKGSVSDYVNSCDTLPLITFPFSIKFNGYGDVVSATRVTKPANQRLCFIGANVEEICISPSGYVYEGLCKN
jgi:MSHA pilin protein MshC